MIILFINNYNKMMIYYIIFLTIFIFYMVNYILFKTKIIKIFIANSFINWYQSFKY